MVTRHDGHLKFLFVRGYSVKKKSAAYVLPERAELKGRFTAASRRAASIGAPRTPSSAKRYKARYEQTNDPTLEETKSLYVH